MVGFNTRLYDAHRQQPITHSGTLDVPGLLDNGRIAPYDLGNCLGIRIFNESTPVTLTIEAGVVVQGHVTSHGWSEGIFHNQIAVGKNAALKVLGTANEPVVFTSAANPDEKNAGQWGGVVFEADSRASDSIIQHAVFEYGGSNRVPTISNPGWVPGMITAYGGAPQISDSLFMWSNVSGLCLRDDAHPSITGCTFTENKIGLTFDVTSTHTISGNSIVKNIDYGAFNENGDVIIDMTNNWWGNVSGPLDDSDDRETGGWYNPEGRGDNVSDYIKYKPWMTDKPTPLPTTVSLAEAVDNTEHTWITGGDADWSGQTSTYYSDGDAAQSGAISDNQYSWIQTVVSGPGTLGFYWKVSSERDADSLEFYIDCIKQDSISGDVDWQQKSYEISSGTHTLMWKYAKNGDTDSGSDCGWLDKVEFSGGPGPTSTSTSTPTGYLWLSDFTSDKIYKLDTSGNVLVSFDSPGSVASDLAWDGTYLWNLDKAAGKIYKLDTAGSVIDSINAPGNINPPYAGGGLAWDGTYLWCTDDGWGKGYTNKIFKLDTAGNVITSFDAPQNDSYSGGLAWDGASLWYVRDYTAVYIGIFVELCNEIYQLDTTGNVLSHFTAPSPGSSGLTWDGAHLWVADAGDDKIYQEDTTGTVLKSSGSPGPSPIGLAWA